MTAAGWTVLAVLLLWVTAVHVWHAMTLDDLDEARVDVSRLRHKLASETARRITAEATAEAKYRLGYHQGRVGGGFPVTNTAPTLSDVLDVRREGLTVDAVIAEWEEES